MGLGVMWLYATDKIMSVASNYIYIELPTVALDGWARISAAKVCSCPAVCAWPSHTDLCVPHVVRMCPQGAIAVVAAVATAAVAAIWVAAATVAVAAVTVLSMFLSSAPTSDMWPTATHASLFWPSVSATLHRSFAHLSCADQAGVWSSGHSGRHRPEGR